MLPNSPQSSSSPTSIPLPREEYGQGWRWLTVLAGLILAASFFMPFTLAYIPNRTALLWLKIVGQSSRWVT